MLTPYPNEFKEAAMVIIDKLRGGTVSNPDAVNAVWNLTGFGLSQTLGGGPLVAGAMPVDGSDAALADYLEGNFVVSAAGSIPWSLLLPILMKLIEKWLS